MKRFATAFAICAVVLASSRGASAQTCGATPADYEWDTTSSDWDVSGAWDPPNNGSYPGEDQTGDTVTIANDAVAVVTLDRALSCNIDTLTLDADTFGSRKTLNIVDDEETGSLTTNGTVQLIGATAGGGQRFAKISVAATTTFAPNDLYLDGGSASGRKAWLDFDENVQTSTSTSVDGCVDVEIADGKWFDAKAMTLVDVDTDLTVTGADTDSILKYDSLTDDYDGKMTFIGPLTVECY